MRKVKKIILTQKQYCVVVDPVDDQFKPQLGKRQLRRGCRSFFLHPGGYLRFMLRHFLSYLRFDQSMSSVLQCELSTICFK